MLARRRWLARRTPELLSHFAVLKRIAQCRDMSSSSLNHTSSNVHLCSEAFDLIHRYRSRDVLQLDLPTKFHFGRFSAFKITDKP
jgi:hypothetical protein